MEKSFIFTHFDEEVFSEQPFQWNTNNLKISLQWSGPRLCLAYVARWGVYFPSFISFSCCFWMVHMHFIIFNFIIFIKFYAALFLCPDTTNSMCTLYPLFSKAWHKVGILKGWSAFWISKWWSRLMLSLFFLSVPLSSPQTQLQDNQQATTVACRLSTRF
jgi:hypothetical protein